MNKYFYAAIAALSLCVCTSPADFDFTHGGHSYSVITTVESWTDAVGLAGGLSVAGQSGYLAEINDAGENAEISSQLQANLTPGDIQNTMAMDGGGASYVWIGANDQVTEGEWRWKSTDTLIGNGQGTAGAGNWISEPGVYNNWGGGNEPDDYNGVYQTGQNAAGIALNAWPYGSAGEWNDVGEANNLMYVVEFNGMIPEPGSVLLFLLGGLGLWRFKR